MVKKKNPTSINIIKHPINKNIEQYSASRNKTLTRENK